MAELASMARFFGAYCCWSKVASSSHGLLRSGFSQAWNKVKVEIKVKVKVKVEVEVEVEVEAEVKVEAESATLLRVLNMFFSVFMIYFLKYVFLLFVVFDSYFVTHLSTHHLLEGIQFSNSRF